MNSKAPRKKIPVKTVFHHVIRAKLYAVLTMNALEGMMLEINTVLTPENGNRNIDIFDEHLRRYQRGILFPTSHGDYLDRAVKSLAKELDVPVNIELVNTQAIKKVIMSLAKGENESEREQISEWLNETNEFIVKSYRYEQLIDNVCLLFYKKPASQVSEDTLNFIKRSTNELLRNKTSKEVMKKRLCTDDEDSTVVDKVIRDNEVGPKGYDMDDDGKDSDSDNELVIGNMGAAFMKRDKTDFEGASGYQDKRVRDTTSMQL